MIIEDDTFKPLLLLLWVPQTIIILYFSYLHFAFPKGWVVFYTNRFKTIWQVDRWFITEIGWLGIILFIGVGIGYIYMTKRLFFEK